MARQPIWHDEYWLMLIQIYMKKPVGVKPIYSRELVQLGMELHIHPHHANDVGDDSRPLFPTHSAYYG